MEFYTMEQWEIMGDMVEDFMSSTITEGQAWLFGWSPEEWEAYCRDCACNPWDIPAFPAEATIEEMLADFSKRY